MTTNYLYGRRSRILVQVNDEKVLDVSDLRCTFKIETVLLYGQVYSIVNIYNLSSGTEKQIIKEGSRVIIEAGYEGADNYGQIFDGQILQPIRWKEDGTTYVLSLICVDGNNYLNFGICNFTIQKGQTARDIANKIAKKSSVSAELGSISKNLSKQKLIRGKVVFGKSKEYLRQLSESNNATYFMKDGKINIIKLSDLPKDEAIKLNSATGMIGMPEQISDGDANYVKVKALLNPKIKIGGLVKLNNSDIKEQQLNFGDVQWLLDVDGLYLVVKATYIGDTRGNDWYVETMCANHTGNLPALIEDPNQVGF